MEIETTVTYMDNTTTTLSYELGEPKEFDKYEEKFLSEIEKNNGILCVGNDSEKCLINFLEETRFSYFSLIINNLFVCMYICLSLLNIYFKTLELNWMKMKISSNGCINV